MLHSILDIIIMQSDDWALPLVVDKKLEKKGTRGEPCSVAHALDEGSHHVLEQ